MFRSEADFEAFERVMLESHQREALRILSNCISGTDQRDGVSFGRL